MIPFDFNRFTAVLRWDFATKRRSFCFGLLGMLLAYLFVFALAHLNYSGHHYEGYAVNMARMVGALARLTFYICLLYYMSLAFRAEHKKPGLVTMAMLPATNLEKFVSRMGYVAVLLMGCALMFFVADALHQLYALVRGEEVAWAARYFFRGYADVSYHGTPDVTFLMLAAVDVFLAELALVAYYLLAGVLFRRQQFLTATVVFAVGFFSFVWAMGHVSSYFPHEGFGRNAFFAFLAVLLLCVISCLVWLAYRLFCRWQLNTHKFVNL